MSKPTFTLDKTYKGTKNVIAGLDLSLRHSGIVIIDSEGGILHKESIMVKVRKKNKVDIHEIVIKVNDIELEERINISNKDNKLDDMKRIVEIKKRIDKVLKMHSVTIVSIEGYSMGSRKGQIFNIAELGGLIKAMLYENNYPYHIIPPKSLKSYISGNGNAEKEDMQRAIQTRYFLSFEDNNEADAFGLAILVMELGEEIFLYCQKNGPIIYRKQIEKSKKGEQSSSRKKKK